MTSTPTDSKVSVDSFARHSSGQMIPVNSSLSYFSVIPLEDTELQRLIYDPASAMPLKAGQMAGKLRIVVVGYLEASEEDPEASPLVVFQPPSEDSRIFSTAVVAEDETYIFLAIKDEDMADSHDSLYYELAQAVVMGADDDLLKKFGALLRQELKNEVRGELDDRAWKLKDHLLRGDGDIEGRPDEFRAYLEQSLADSLALYFHGLCCDIDVEAGPRQLASKWIRKRLTLLRELLPAPKGVALFPEELPPTA